MPLHEVVLMNAEIMFDPVKAGLRKKMKMVRVRRLRACGKSLGRGRVEETNRQGPLYGDRKNRFLVDLAFGGEVWDDVCLANPWIHESGRGRSL